MIEILNIIGSSGQITGNFLQVGNAVMIAPGVRIFKIFRLSLSKTDKQKMASRALLYGKAR